MPVWLRKFTFKTIKEYYDKQKESTSEIQNVEKILKPSVLPKATYTTQTKPATKK